MNFYKQAQILLLLTAVLTTLPGSEKLYSQERYTLKMSLEDVILTATEQSPNALINKHNFLVSYWQNRSYKALFLPSLNLSATIGNYNRSLVALQNYETGEINYRVNNNMHNSLSLSLRQNIALTGGTVSLSTSLNRLDQFSGTESVLYNSQPVYINYSQPIKAYNAFKWQKITEPKEFENAKRRYLENMEDVKQRAISLFFEVLTAQSNLELSKMNLASSELSLKIAEERFEIGSVTYNEILQLRLNLNNSKLALGDNQVALDISMASLRTFLGFNDNTVIELAMPGEVPEMLISFDEVYDRSLESSSFFLDKELALLSAKQEVEKAKSGTGLQADLFATLGFTQKGSDLGAAYKSPIDQEIVGLRLTLPILDWGLGKGKVKLALSREEVAKAQVEQALIQNRQDVLIKVMRFNKQNIQCRTSAEADSIARISYNISQERFRNGTISILELNDAQTRKDNAVQRYISDLGSYWKYYYDIRRISLYDYLTGKEITVDFERLTGN